MPASLLSASRSRTVNVGFGTGRVTVYVTTAAPCAVIEMPSARNRRPGLRYRRERTTGGFQFDTADAKRLSRNLLIYQRLAITDRHPVDGLPDVTGETLKPQRHA